MKITDSLKSFLLIIGILFNLNIQGQTEQSANVHVEIAGTLNTLISSTDKFLISDLTLTGFLNSDDINFIRIMAGQNNTGGKTSNYNLKTLNLADANIVAGGTINYYYSQTTINNSISDYMFQSCNLVSIVLPNNVNTIGRSSFLGCKDLISVSIPESVTSIGDNSFQSCEKLSNIIIPENVSSIGSNTFYQCNSLTSVNIPHSVTSLGVNSFQYSGLLTVTIGRGVTSNIEKAFDCWNLKEFIVSTENPNYSSNDGVLFNKDMTKILAYPQAKSGSYDIPNSITTIGRGSFSNSHKLTSITIPNSVTKIEYAAFYRSAITLIAIPNSVISMEGRSFDSCPLNSVTIGNSITTIEEQTFTNTKIANIIIPDNVTSIGDNVFQNCNELTSISLGNGLTSIGNFAFAQCSKLNSIVIPDNVTSIGVFAFQACIGLKSADLGDGLTSIPLALFSNCSALTNVVIPISVTSIGSTSFSDCSGLTTIDIPNSVVSIGSGSFVRCSKLTKVVIPNGVKSIESNVFSGCTGLESITIPKSITSFGYNVFNGCTNLNEIYAENNIPINITNILFNDINKNNCILYVPIGSSALYKKAVGWKDFTNIVEKITTSTGNLSERGWSVYSENNAIVVEGENIQQVSVFDLSGKLVKTARKTESIMRVNVNKGNTYLVKVNDLSVKVIL